MIKKIIQLLNDETILRKDFKNRLIKSALKFAEASPKVSLAATTMIDCNELKKRASS